MIIPSKPLTKLFTLESASWKVPLLISADKEAVFVINLCSASGAKLSYEGIRDDLVAPRTAASPIAVCFSLILEN